MNADTLLYRQVHPHFIQNENVTSQAFIPSSNDDKQLSVYDGDLISAKDAWKHYTNEFGRRSAGVVAVSRKECDAQSLPVESDPETFLSHVLINFKGYSRSQIKNRIANELAMYARERGWRYRPPAE